MLIRFCYRFRFFDRQPNPRFNAVVKKIASTCRVEAMLYICVGNYSHSMVAFGLGDMS